MARPSAHVVADSDEGTGNLCWTPSLDTGTLTAAIRVAVAAAFGQGLRRIQAKVSPDDRESRSALHRAGFRLEGRLRGAALDPDGSALDVLLYALLREDTRDGPEGFTAVMNTVTPRKRLIAHTLVTDEADRVLLCETSFKRDWELPGGIVEPDESPRTACQRELTEELGISFAVGRVLALDWLHPHLGWEDALEVIFASPPLSPAQVAAIRPDGREIVAVHWLDVMEATRAMAPYAVGRLLAAWDAREHTTTAYLEDGRPIGT